MKKLVTILVVLQLLLIVGVVGSIYNKNSSVSENRTEHVTRNQNQDQQVNILIEALNRELQEANKTLKEANKKPLPAPVKVEREKITLTDKNSIVIRGPIMNDSMARVQADLLQMLPSIDKTQPFYLVLDSPGGSVFAGFGFIDFLKGLGLKVETITLFSASMAFQMVQSFGTRYIVDNGVLMSHRANGGVDGDFEGNLDSRMNFFKSMFQVLDQQAADRMRVPLQEYKQKIADEYWTFGAKSVQEFASDKLADVQCDASLQGLLTQDIPIFMMNIIVSLTYSQCPMIQGVLSIKIKRLLELDKEGKLHGEFTPGPSKVDPEKIAEIKRIFSDNKYTLRRYVIPGTLSNVIGE